MCNALKRIIIKQIDYNLQFYSRGFKNKVNIKQPIHYYNLYNNIQHNIYIIIYYFRKNITYCILHFL